MGGVSALGVVTDEVTGAVRVLDVDRRVPWYVAGPGSAGPGSIFNEESVQGRILKFHKRGLEGDVQENSSSKIPCFQIFAHSKLLYTVDIIYR